MDDKRVIYKVFKRLKWNSFRQNTTMRGMYEWRVLFRYAKWLGRVGYQKIPKEKPMGNPVGHVDEH